MKFHIRGRKIKLDIPFFSHPARHALERPNLAYYTWRYVRNGGKILRFRRSSIAFPETKNIAATLKRDGVVLGPSATYLSDEGRQALTSVSAKILALSDGPEVKAAVAQGASDYDQKPFITHLFKSEHEHSVNSDLVKLALDNKLLEIIAGYLGMWPRLRSIGAWVNFPTPSEAESSQLWHRDPGGIQIVKVFIYLVDVDERLGPFCYVPGTQSFGPAAGRVIKSRDPIRIMDEELDVVFKPEERLVCKGPAGTMIIADTVGFHRGGKPSAGNRILVTFQYTADTKRHVRTKGVPTWPLSPLQEHALLA